jgi:hypothetical protein
LLAHTRRPIEPASCGVHASDNSGAPYRRGQVHPLKRFSPLAGVTHRDQHAQNWREAAGCVRQKTTDNGMIVVAFGFTRRIGTPCGYTRWQISPASLLTVIPVAGECPVYRSIFRRINNSANHQRYAGLLTNPPFFENSPPRPKCAHSQFVRLGLFISSTQAENYCVARTMEIRWSSPNDTSRLTPKN